MNGKLSREAEALIRDAIAEEAPVDALRRRRLKRAVLSAALAPGVAAGALPQAHGTAAAAGGGGATSATQLALLLAKGAGAGVLVAGALYGAVSVSRPALQSAPAPVSTGSSARPAPATTQGGRPALAPSTPATSATAPSGSGAPSAAPFAERAGVSSRAASPSNGPPAQATRDAAPSLRAELELMSAVQAALRDGRTARALELVAQHAALYPQGQLVHERLAAEALAACRSGDLERGRRAAELVLARDATSALATRVRNACSLAGTGPR